MRRGFQTQSVIALALAMVFNLSIICRAIASSGMPGPGPWGVFGQVPGEEPGLDAPSHTAGEEKYPVHVAAGAGEKERLAALVASGANVNTLDETGCSALHCACMEGQSACVKLLLEQGAARDVRDEDGYTALDRAVELGYESIARELLSGAVDVESRDRFGRTLLARAAEGGMTVLVAELLAKGSNVNGTDNQGDTPLHKAATLEDAGVALALLEAGAEVNAANKSGFTSLHHAVIEGRSETAQALIAAGAEVLAKSVLGTSALHIAVQKGDVALATILLDSRADANAYTTLGDTPLYIALCDGNKEMVALLAEHGATTFSDDPCAWRRILGALKTTSRDIAELIPPPDCRELARSDNCVNMLRKALQVGDARLAEGLIAEGTSIAIEDPDDNSVLHLAALLGDARLCERVLAQGVTIESYNKNGETPLILAVRSNDRDTVKLILDQGAEIFSGGSRSWLWAVEVLIRSTPEVAALFPDWNLGARARKTDDEGLTVLYAAVREKRSDIARLLLSVGADPNVCDAKKMTPLHWAMQGCDVRTAQSLLGSGADLSLEDKEGATPLDTAIAAGFDLRELQEALVAQGDMSLASGDMVDARLAYGAAVRLEAGASPQSIAARSFVLTFARQGRALEPSCTKWMSERRFPDEDADRVRLALAEYFLNYGENDDALNILTPMAQKTNALGFAASVLRAICLAAKGNVRGATSQLQAVAENTQAGEMGIVARHLLANGCDDISRRRNLLSEFENIVCNEKALAKENEERIGLD